MGREVLLKGLSQLVTRFQLSAGGVVCREDNAGRLEVVLIATQGGERWGLPKGLVEKGESLEDAARREVREETGLEAEIIDRLQPVEYWYWWSEGGEKVRYRKKVYFYLMSYKGSDAKQHDGEVDEARWFALDEAIGRVSYRTEREVLRQALERRGL